jgi:hypothetical protein
MRASLSLLLVAVLAAPPALASHPYSAAHTRKLVRMRQYPKHGKAQSPPSHHKKSKAHKH